MNFSPWLVVPLGLWFACRPTVSPTERKRTDAPTTAARRAPSAPPAPTRSHGHNPDLLPAADASLPDDRRALQISDGQERSVDVELARARGLTVVDLSDGWAPIIFADGTGPAGQALPNEYRRVFVGLANDKTDGDGQPLLPTEKNYLELLGVPPSLSVLSARLQADARCDCGAVDRPALLAVGEITTWGATTEQKELARAETRARRLDARQSPAGGRDLDAARASPHDARWAREVEAHRKFVAERAAFDAVEKRVTCEGLLAWAHHQRGRYDSPMRAAVLAFQQKHALMAQGDLNRSTLQALARSPLELDFAALRRTLAERAVHAAGILEDGSATDATGAPATYLGNDGQRRAVPDLVSQATEALLVALDLQGADDAVAFFRRHRAGDFGALKIAARFPPLPDYYGPGRALDLSAEIDRGDVWYDFPFDAKGTRLPQPRERFPTFTLYALWRGERVALVRWRTTVGGWRSEVASDQQEYYVYKGSDVGARVWRHVVAAPVWIPPATSPLGSMVKEKRVNGAFVNVTNYDETGPGFLSAYGLVAAIHEQMSRDSRGLVFSDNGIRTHGSFDYLSLRGRFSHGCHRLYNHAAVRLFSFILAHHAVRAIGNLPLNFRRTFWSRGELYDLRLPNRGFYFELQPPIPIQTTEGRIRGQRQTPVAGYVRKPGVRYLAPRLPAPEVSQSPDSKAAGGGEP
jgi:hypothetical protein